MLVDDESLFREALRKTIPWETLGYEVCCEAENGIDALEKIQLYKPHVALVDINMPMLDGIELAAEIKENGLNVNVIIITGYGEFEYARQAIEVGVNNYLLKPIQEDQLVKALAAVKKKLDAETEELKRQVKVYRPLLKEMLLSNLLQGTKLLALEETRKLKASLAVDPDARPYWVMAIEIATRRESSWDEGEKRLWTFAVANVARDILESRCVFETCQDTERVCSVIHAKDADSAWPLDVVRLGERIRQAVRQYLKLEVAIGISGSREGMDGLPRSYGEALYALHNRHVKGNNQVVSYNEVVVSDEAALRIYPAEQRQQLLMAARMYDTQLVRELVQAIFGEIRRANASIELLANKCVELVSTCQEFVEGTGREWRSVFEEGGRLLDSLHKRESIEEWEGDIQAMYAQAMRAVFAQAGQGASRTVEQAKKYIDDHLDKFDLKIDEIARHVYIGYGRLCELFKRETGVTINHYITDARIRMAKKLIDEGHHSVSAVSARVGYADANYFGKSFKKKYGIAPGNYIDNRLSQRNPG